MGRTEQLIRQIDRVQSRIPVFVASVVLLGMLLVGSCLLAWHTSRQQEQLRHAYADAASLIETATEIRLAALNLIRGERGYLLTGNPDYLQPYAEGREHLAVAMAELPGHAARKPALRQDVVKLEDTVAVYTTRLEEIVRYKRAGEHAKAMALVRTDRVRAALNEIDRHLTRMAARERARLMVLERRVTGANRYQAILLVIVSGVALFLIVLAALTVVALRRSFARERAYREELRRQAQTDELTGIANRRELMTNLHRAISLCRRDEKPLAVALFDIDHFKKVNDTYGHAAGDEVIRKLALTASATVRGSTLSAASAGRNSRWCSSAQEWPRPMPCARGCA